MCVGNGIGFKLRRGARCRRAVRACVRQLRGGAGRDAELPPRRHLERRAGQTTEDYALIACGETRRRSAELLEDLRATRWRRCSPYTSRRPRRGRCRLLRRCTATGMRSVQRSIAAPARAHPRVPGHQLRVRHRRAPSSRRAPMPEMFVINNLHRPQTWPRAVEALARRPSRQPDHHASPAASPAATSRTAPASSSRPSSAHPAVAEAVHDLLQNSATA